MRAPRPPPSPRRAPELTPRAAARPLARRRERCQITTCKQSDSTDQLFAFFPAAHEKLGKKEIDRYLLQMRQEEVKRAVLVLQQQPTSFASQIINRLSDELTLEVFLDHELMVNITQHELVPKHEVLNDEQKKALLARYKLKETQLPRILKTDAVARYYGLKRGQVVKVIRPSETAGRYVVRPNAWLRPRNVVWQRAKLRCSILSPDIVCPQTYRMVM